MPKLTVILLTYNRRHYLKYSLESILNQTYKDIKIIVLDNGSSDDTEEFVKSYLEDNRLSYVKNKTNMWHEPLINKICDLCQTEYMMIVFDDDIIDNTIIEKELPYLENDKEVVFVGCGARLINEVNEVLVGNYFVEEKALLFDKYEYIKFYGRELKALFIDSSIIRRTDAVKQIDYSFFNNIAENGEWVLKLNEIGKMCILTDILVSYRIHNGQDSNKKLALKEAEYRILRPHMLKYLNEEEIMGFDDKFKNIIDGFKLSTELFGENLTVTEDDFYNLPDVYSYIRQKNYTAGKHFLYCMKYLKERFTDGKRYVLWGAGSSGEATKEFIDMLLPSFNYAGCIDKYKRGNKYGAKIYAPDEFCFDKSLYIFICTTPGISETIDFLKNKGYTPGDNFILGYGTFH